MAYRIARTPPTAGEHSLGQEVLTFNDLGIAFTDNPETIAAARDFPTTFEVSEVIVGKAEDPPGPTKEEEALRLGGEVARLGEEVTRLGEDEATQWQQGAAPEATASKAPSDPSLDPDAILRDAPPPQTPPPSTPDRRRR